MRGCNTGISGVAEDTIREQKEEIFEKKIA
jgi:hypothetical protein